MKLKGKVVISKDNLVTAYRDVTTGERVVESSELPVKLRDSHFVELVQSYYAEKSFVRAVKFIKAELKLSLRESKELFDKYRYGFYG